MDYDPAGMTPEELDKLQRYGPTFGPSGYSAPDAPSIGNDNPPSMYEPALPDNVPSTAAQPVSPIDAPMSPRATGPSMMTPKPGYEPVSSPYQTARVSTMPNRSDYGLNKKQMVGAGLLGLSDPKTASEMIAKPEQEYEAALGQHNVEQEQALKEKELQQRPELAELGGEMRGRLAEQQQNAALKREQEIIEGQNKRAEGAQTGANTRAAGANKTKEEIATDTEAGKEKIEKMREQNAKDIAAAHDLTQQEVAKIRGQFANDPNKLTVTMKTMKQQAQATLPQIDKALDETEKVAGMLGPEEGRWNDFIQGKIGVADPQFAHYRDEIHMISTAVTLAHARGRMSNELYDSFNKMFDAGKQAPENMVQALNVAHEWLNEYANMGEPGSPVGNTPAGGGGKPSSFKEWKSGQ